MITLRVHGIRTFVIIELEVSFKTQVQKSSPTALAFVYSVVSATATMGPVTAFAVDSSAMLRVSALTTLTETFVESWDPRGTVRWVPHLYARR